nr:hypothetical protein [uncultured Pedobacter sp.]
MNIKLYLLVIVSCFHLSAAAQSQITTTGNNIINLTNPYAADITIGSNANGGTRHNSSIMFWSDNSASRIYGADDKFYFSIWNSPNPNISLASGYGVASYFKGNLGVGTTNPLDPLDVKDIFRISGFNRNWRIMSHVADGSLYIRDETATNMVMTFTTAGYVGIGTTSPAEKLSVNGKIRAHEIKVEATNWPDYVFDRDYKILGLNELDAYIKQHKHLPDMPSAKEVEAKGVELGEMNKLLLKKVEELTLHLIEKDKQLIAEQNINHQQQNRLKLIEEKLKIK